MSGCSSIIIFDCLNPLLASVVWWSEFLPPDPEVRVRFPALPDFLSSGSGTTVSISDYIASNK
jgi:hypothetical protein